MKTNYHMIHLRFLFHNHKPWRDFFLLIWCLLENPKQCWSCLSQLHLGLLSTRVSSDQRDYQSTPHSISTYSDGTVLTHLQGEPQTLQTHKCEKKPQSFLSRNPCLLLLLLSHFSCVQPCVTPWTADHQAPLSTGFSRQEYWSGLPFPSPKSVPIAS